MTTSKVEPSERFHDENSVQKGIGLWPLTGYFLKLGTIGFGGPVALVGFMHRDLVEQRRWITEDTYKLSLALAQIMPGPLAAQTAIAIGYFEGGILGATLVGLGFHFSLVSDGGRDLVGLRRVWRAVVDASALLCHRRNGHRHHRHCRLQAGAQHQQARSAPLGHLRRAHRRDRLGAEPSWRSSLSLPDWWFCFFGRGQVGNRGFSWHLAWRSLGSGCLAAGGVARARPGQQQNQRIYWLRFCYFLPRLALLCSAAGWQSFRFLQQGVVQQFGWLNEHQFLDAVAVAMITPGPVVITVAFIGFLVAGLAGSVMASIGIFLPVYVFTIVPAPWFKRHRDNPQLKAFVDGATAAATGAITGAVIVLGARAITDLPTAIIALVSFGVLWRYKISEPIIVTISGLVGLILWPLVRGG